MTVAEQNGIRRVVVYLMIYFRSDAMIQVFGFWRFSKRGERMSTAEAIGLMFAFGIFILALLTYIDRNQKK